MHQLTVLRFRKTPHLRIRKRSAMHMLHLGRNSTVLQQFDVEQHYRCFCREFDGSAGRGDSE